MAKRVWLRMKQGQTRRWTSLPFRMYRATHVGPLCLGPPPSEYLSFSTRLGLNGIDFTTGNMLLFFSPVD